MKFPPRELVRLAAAIRWLSPREQKALSGLLHRRQPDFCEIIDDVGTDPRCADAHRFCTLFCALALRQVEETAGDPLPKLPRASIRETAGFIARGEAGQIGKASCGFRKQMEQHVLGASGFDEDDTAWLATTISTFLFFVAKPPGRTR